MKTVYIPKGETVHYESLVTEHLVVHGHLHVTYGIKAKTITGKGVINAGTVEADTVCIDDVEAASVICKRLLAKRVQAPEVFASESAAVSCFLSAAYVETGKLTAAISEIDVVEAQEVVNLKPKKRSLFLDCHDCAWRESGGHGRRVYSRPGGNGRSGAGRTCCRAACHRAGSACRCC